MRLLVIDDHPIVLDGIAALLAGLSPEATVLTARATRLEGWGYKVVGAGSGEAAIAELAQWPICPDLVISDHWLRSGETGFDLIDRVRVEYNDDIPAILITGDTGPALLAEAKSAGFVLLQKPTHNGKLRAAIARSLAGRLISGADTQRGAPDRNKGTPGMNLSVGPIALSRPAAPLRVCG